MCITFTHNNKGQDMAQPLQQAGRYLRFSLSENVYTLFAIKWKLRELQSTLGVHWKSKSLSFSMLNCIALWNFLIWKIIRQNSCEHTLFRSRVSTTTSSKNIFISFIFVWLTSRRFWTILSDLLTTLQPWNLSWTYIT